MKSRAERRASRSARREAAAGRSQGSAQVPAESPVVEASAPASAPAPVRRLPRWAAALSAALLSAFVLQASVATRRDSVTIDEVIHLGVGLHTLTTGDLRQDPIDSHLLRIAAAIPVWMQGPAWDPPADTASWGFGLYFNEANAPRMQQLYQSARYVVIGVSLLAALVMAKWALDLYGAGAAVVSLFLFAFSPSLLAHGHLVTIDMAGTLGFLVALFANWRFLADPTPRRAAWLGAAIALANLLKLSGAVLVAMILATWAIRAFAERRSGPSPLQWAKLLAITGAVTVVGINLGYGFDGSFGLLSGATLAPGGKLARLAEAAPWLRLPLPRAFLDGVDMVLEVGKGHEPSYFLAGELSADGWWYYHLVAFAAKCPLPVLASSLFAVAAWLAGRSPGRRDYAVFVPVALLFAANSAFNSLAIGERHVLAAYPLLFVAASPWIASGVASVLQVLRGGAVVAGMREAPKRALAAAAALVVVGWTVAGTAAVAPRYLQYFNEAAGGPERGHRILIDSNIDWGQDLIRLREWMDANKVDRVALAYFGRVDPRVYGVNFTPLERGVSHGKAVVSASFLMGRPYFWYLGGRMRWVPARTYEWLQGHKPVARVGSMFVFDLP